MSERLTEDQTHQYEMAIKLAPIGVLLLDGNGLIECASDKAVELLTVDVEGEFLPLVGKAVTEFFPQKLIDSLTTKSARKRATVGGIRRTFEIQIRNRSNDRLGILYFSDAETQQRRERLLEKEASTDELSGLANRRAFQRLMESNQLAPLSLAIIDIDNFKQINDLRGHLAGDDAIRLVSQTLRECFEEFAIVIARMGGDEFSVLCKTSEEYSFYNQLEEFRIQLAQSRLAEYPKVGVTVSIGTVVSAIPDISARTLLTAADRQLYLAKNSGRNRQCVVQLDQTRLPD